MALRQRSRRCEFAGWKRVRILEHPGVHSGIETRVHLVLDEFHVLEGTPRAPVRALASSSIGLSRSAVAIDV